VNIRTSLIAGLGLIVAGGLAGQTQAATTTTNQAPSPASAQLEASSGTSQSGSSQASNMPSASNSSSGMSQPNSASGMSQQEVKALQQALKGQGENVTTDGVWGPDTQSALKHYQEQNGLPVTGQLDQATRSKLNLQG
jgi:peptidoglycan hydrolase-like protein with peptidoglycan-binding domain